MRFYCAALLCLWGWVSGPSLFAATPQARVYSSATKFDTRPNAAERRLIQRLNEIRRRSGLGPLTVSPDLVMVCREHSEDMAGNDYFEVISPTLGSLEYRLRRIGTLFQPKDRFEQLPG